MITYTDPTLLDAVRSDLRAPKPNPYASGYGPKIPTRHSIRYAGVWRRVYVMRYGNSGSAYVRVKGVDTFLDIPTEYALQGVDWS